MHKTNTIATTIALALSLMGISNPSFAAANNSAEVGKVAAVAPAALKDSTLATSPVKMVKDTAKMTQVTVDTSKPAPTIVDTTKKVDGTVGVDTTKSAIGSAVPVIAPISIVDSLRSDSLPADTSKSSAPKKRKRIVRETTVNTIDELKGRYRSPKKAMFMSLIVPGLGQTYVGQHWANYTRAAFYFMTDVALAYGWHYYVVDKQDRQITKYRKFADANWKQSRYENFLSSHLGATFDKDKFGFINSHRQAYCDAVQGRDGQTAVALYNGCIEPNQAENYAAFKSQYNDENWSADTTSLLRSQFVNPHNFYEVVGKEVEFITGWSDAGNIEQSDSAFYIKDGNGAPLKNAKGELVPATTALQQRYISMRGKANDYARMQAYFLGGIVINHLVSALDAALTAHYHNKTLYQTDVQWWNRVRLDGGLAWQGLEPATSVTAHLTF